jgi:DNA-binding response OmpR family regulator
MTTKTKRPRPHSGVDRGESRRHAAPGRSRDPWRPEELGQRFRVSHHGSSGQATGVGRILIVDDEAAIRLVCRVNLQAAGFDTLEAADGKNALAIARSEMPDLILLDVMMPELDGWSVAEQLAADPQTGGIPILFLSARSEVADEARGLELGGIGYVVKPFDPVDLAGKVQHVLERVRRGEHETVRSEWARSLEER